MSGTSLDGLDMALVRLSHDGNWQYSFVHALTVPYPDQWVGRLRHALQRSPEELEKLDEEYTRYLAEAVLRFRESHPDSIDLIASHGHTVHHRPEEGVTVQIGNRPELATLTGLTTVCDFRVQDVEMGGQGAPLVPMGDRLLFGQYDYCINLGGFANISFERDGQRVAFDICPVNVMLNHFAGKMGEAYDRDGAFAKAGTVKASLLKKLNDLDFYQSPPPKSLGMEWVNRHFLPLIPNDLSPEDVLATLTEHVAIQVSHVVEEDTTALITGGGAKNSYLMQRIEERSGLKLAEVDEILVDYKEALVFALLGVLRFRKPALPAGRSFNILASVTGARRDHCSGKTFQP